MARLNVKKAKFYCESCGSEVAQNAKFCSTCGKFFTFVRCPSCQFTGDAKKFTNGCPKCGYAFKANSYSSASSYDKKKKSSFFSGLFGESNKTPKETNEDSSLPWWIYVIAVCALISVLFGFYSCLK